MVAPREHNAFHNHRNENLARRYLRGRAILTFSLLLICVASLAAPPVSPCADTLATHLTSDSTVIRIMTYNIRYDNPDDGIHAWPNRKSELLAFVLSERIDVFCIQEGLHEQVMFLKHGQPGFDLRGVGRDDGKEKGEYSAIFFNASRFTCLQDGTFWLSPHPDIPSKGWDAALPRIVTWVRLFDSITKKSFFVFNTHFDHQGAEARENSARLVRSKIREIGGVLPVILTGDFNSTEDQPPYRVLLSRNGNPPWLLDGMYQSRIPHQGPVSTFTGFEFEETEPDIRIDYVFASEGVHVKSHRTLIARSTHGYLSDHLPVVAEIILP